MEGIQNFFGNKYIAIPILLWLAIQSFKVAWDLITTKKFNFKRILGAGGMPSSLSLIFACIVMYDAAGVRRAAGKQAQLLNKIINTPGLSGIQVQEKLVEVLGHTPTQVFVGALIGIIAGIIF